MKALPPLLAFLVFLTVGFRAPALPRYTPLTLPQMVMMSGLTVHGSIVEVKSKTFVLKVETVLKGELKPADQKTKRIEVQRFQNWACASRWAEYKTGQEVLLFLTANGRTGLVPKILSGGGEGEMPMISPSAQKPALKWVVLRGRDVAQAGTEKRWSAYGAERDCTAAELGATLQDLREFHACFRTKADPNTGSVHRMRFTATQLLPEQRVQKLAKRSKLARYLVEQARAQAPQASKK